MGGVRRLKEAVIRVSGRYEGLFDRQVDASDLLRVPVPLRRRPLTRGRRCRTAGWSGFPSGSAAVLGSFLPAKAGGNPAGSLTRSTPCSSVPSLHLYRICAQPISDLRCGST